MAPKYGQGRDDDDEAPWLREVDGDVSASTAVPRGRLIGGIILFLLLLVLVITGVYVIIGKKQDGASGTGVSRPEDAPLIAADAGPYKIPPTDAGGMDVEGQGDTVYDTGSGKDAAGTIDATAAPEDPLPRPGQEPTSILPPAAGEPAAIPPPPVAAAPKQAAPVVAPVAATPKPVMAKPAVAAPVPVKAAPAAPKPEAAAAKPAATPAPAATASGHNLQLGAFSSEAKADAAWAALTGQFAFLAPLGKQIVPVVRDGATLYRLRATGAGDAAGMCTRLKAAGASCLVTP